VPALEKWQNMGVGHFELKYLEILTHSLCVSLLQIHTLGPYFTVSKDFTMRRNSKCRGASSVNITEIQFPFGGVGPGRPPKRGYLWA